MSRAIVVDASVAVKWVLVEELSDRAHALLQEARRVRRRLVAPPHLPAEVTNALYQRLRRHDLSEQEAQEALETYLDFEIDLLDPPGLYQKAFNLSTTYALPSTYDSLYLALADTLEAAFWTNDRRLIDARVPWARPISDFEEIGPE